jgi:hypothetical protein
MGVSSAFYADPLKLSPLPQLPYLFVQSGRQTMSLRQVGTLCPNWQQPCLAEQQLIVHRLSTLLHAAPDQQLPPDTSPSHTCIVQCLRSNPPPLPNWCVPIHICRETSPHTQTRWLPQAVARGSAPSIAAAAPRATPACSAVPAAAAACGQPQAPSQSWGRLYSGTAVPWAAPPALQEPVTLLRPLKRSMRSHWCKGPPSYAGRG